MSSGKYLDHGLLMQWADDFKKNKNLGHSTNSAAISLSQFESFIAELKAEYENAADLTGLRFYFVRYPSGRDTAGRMPEDIEKEPKNDKLTQPSILVVPVRSYDHIEGTGKDYIKDNPGEIYTLTFVDPATGISEDSTTLCPPKCSNGGFNG